MLPLHERLQGVVNILEQSNMELHSPKADATGFVAVPPEFLADAVMALLAHTDSSKTSLDLGCGNGGWMLLAAAAGFPSYGIDINPFLIEHAQRNYALALASGFIDPATPCAFITGDMIPPGFSTRYDAFRKLHDETPQSMPIGAVVEDAYVRLPTSIAAADIIYCWAWPTQSRFIYNMIGEEGKPAAIFVLPCYERYTQGEHVKIMSQQQNTLFLVSLEMTHDIVIGTRAPGKCKNVSL